MQFVLITRHDLEDTNALFRAACTARGMAYCEVEAGQARSAELGSTAPRLIYTAATDWNSRLLEKLIARPGDALLHDPHFICDHQPSLLKRAGVPMARAVYAPDLSNLQNQVAWLGGFPVVVKRPGLEGGQGISIAHDLDDLTAQLGAADASGAMIEAYIAHDICWRLTVLDGRVLAESASAPAADDFRSNAAGGRVVERLPVPEQAGKIAIDAVRALRLGFGGVDLMAAQDGRLIVAEVNFPCYFADQQARLGVDIAGAIVDHLVANSGAMKV